jgi:hypothetical protein
MAIVRKRLGKKCSRICVDNNRTSVAGYRKNKDAAMTIGDKNKRCFLCDPCRDSSLGNWVVPRLYSNIGVAFPVPRGPCHDCVTESNSEASGCRSTEE